MAQVPSVVVVPCRHTPIDLSSASWEGSRWLRVTRDDRHALTSCSEPDSLWPDTRCKRLLEEKPAGRLLMQARGPIARLHKWDATLIGEMGDRLDHGPLAGSCGGPWTRQTVTSCTTGSRVFAALAGKRVMHRVVYQDIGVCRIQPGAFRARPGDQSLVRPQRPVRASMARRGAPCKASHRRAGTPSRLAARNPAVPI